MRWLKSHWDLPQILLLAVLFAGVAVRFCFADANSYWLDELYSVVVYGIAHASVVDAIRELTSSIHPPLYQFILYNWMTVFGDSEVATRSLSNLYVLGGTLCLALAVRKIYGPWLGVIVAIVFTLMFTPTYYGMETRSYAQTIFLSSLSTLLLTYALPRIAKKSWRGLIRDGWVYAFLATNTALLMTHYYNVLFLAAQALFFIVYLLYRDEKPLDAIVKAFAAGVTPLIALLIAWGPVMLASYSSRVASYVVEGLPMLPWEILSEMVIRPNFSEYYIYYAVVALLALVTVTTLARLARRPDNETLFTLWFLLASTAPALLAFVLFFFSGHERYNNRYFSFSVGPLAVLVVLGIYQVMMLARRAVPVLSRAALIVTATIGVLLAYPGGINALQWENTDWRGIAEAIVDRIKREPEKTFAVYETTFRKYPTLNYYLSRFSGDVRVRDTLQMVFEGRGSIEFSPPDADYAIVAFTHHKVRSFPKTLEVLEGRMKLTEKHLNKKGRGYLVFEVPK